MASKVGVHCKISLVYAAINVNFLTGYIVSDWGATHDSAADNANAGLDMEQPGDYILIGKQRTYYSRLIIFVHLFLSF